MPIPWRILLALLPFGGIRILAPVAFGAGLLLVGSSGVSLAAVDTPEGPPPCGSDGICNLAVCDQDPDCPAGLPKEHEESHPDSALDEVIDCNSTQEKDIRAVAWNIVDDWSNFAHRVVGAYPYVSEIPPTIRMELNDFYRPHNQRLYEVLGADFGW